MEKQVTVSYSEFEELKTKANNFDSGAVKIQFKIGGDHEYETIEVVKHNFENQALSVEDMMDIQKIIDKAYETKKFWEDIKNREKHNWKSLAKDAEKKIAETQLSFMGIRDVEHDTIRANVRINMLEESLNGIPNWIKKIFI